jgi:N-methylhydantoinase A/oxoprolinase/acetone carboxylase beta subunit
LAKITKKSTLREALKEKRQVYFHEAGGFTEATIYDRSKLPGNTTFDGPAVVEQPDTTTVMPPGSTGVVDDYGNLVIRIK